jgi:hypothetical protein
MTGSATVTVNPLPTLFTVGGGGTICSGAAGVAVTLSGSQAGVNYQLFRGATAVGTAVAGTGAALSWAGQTTAGTYTVVATNATTSCNITMTGSAIIDLTSELNWTGAAGDNDWFNPANWNAGAGCIPSCVLDAVITGGAGYPRINTAGAAARNLTIGTGKNVEFTSAVSTLSVCGNVTATGAILPTAGGTLLFVGTGGIQTYAGTTSTLNSVTVNNTNGVRLLSNMTLGSSGILRLQSGKIDANSNTLWVQNPSPSAAVESASAISYLYGGLFQRAIQASGQGLYEFPVGDPAFYHPAEFDWRYTSDRVTHSRVAVGFVAGTPPNDNYSAINTPGIDGCSF